jgi:hypothetical protein
MKFLSDKISKMNSFEVLLRAMFVSVAGLFYLLSAWQAFESGRVIATHEKATAIVTASSAEGTGESRFQTYRIEAKFSTERGNHRTTISRAQSGFEPGAEITIYYQPETAYTSYLGGFMGLWFLPTMIGVFGSIFLFFAAIPNNEQAEPEPPVQDQ